jgi:protein-tyrosine phosphatase
MSQKILIICVGNICRSPMCEAIFSDKFGKHSSYHVSSAGLGALVDSPADPFAQKLMLEKGLDIGAHRARQITREMLLTSDIIFTMSTRQQDDIEIMMPSLRGRIYRLGNWGGYDVPDPYQRPIEAFDQALTLIEQGIEDWFAKLWNGYVKKNECAQS